MADATRDEIPDNFKITSAGQDLKNTGTHDNLKVAFSGDSQASDRYLYFAKIAEIEGHPELAEAFRRLAEVGQGYSHGHLDYLKRVGDPLSGRSIGETSSNLEAAIAAERYEAEAIYPSMARTAHGEGFADIANWFETLERVKRAHVRQLEALREALEGAEGT